jgi:hypothetical protein
MNEGTLERSWLAPETFMLTRIAALAAAGAPPVSYLVNKSSLSSRRAGRCGRCADVRFAPRDALQDRWGFVRADAKR